MKQIDDIIERLNGAKNKYAAFLQLKILIADTKKLIFDLQDIVYIRNAEIETLGTGIKQLQDSFKEMTGAHDYIFEQYQDMGQIFNEEADKNDKLREALKKILNSHYLVELWKESPQLIAKPPEQILKDIQAIATKALNDTKDEPTENEDEQRTKN